MMNAIVKILVERDHMSKKEAEQEFLWLAHDVKENGKDPYSVLKSIGLESDYSHLLLK